jgi:hypothetical protein
VRHIVKHVTLFLMLIGIGIAPHYLLALNHIITYLYANLIQKASIWAYQGTVMQHVLFYLIGNGGQVMLGKHLYLLGLILIIGGVVQFKICTKEAYLRFVLLWVLTWIAWLIPTIHPTKAYFIGIVFDVLLFFSTVLVFRNVLNSPVIRHYIPGQMLVIVHYIFCSKTSPFNPICKVDQ